MNKKILMDPARGGKKVTEPSGLGHDCKQPALDLVINFTQCCGSGSVCFFGLLGSDPLVRGTDPDPAPDPSIIKQK
jgi:hypothetical protein